MAPACAAAEVKAVVQVLPPAVKCPGPVEPAASSAEEDDLSDGDDEEPPAPPPLVLRLCYDTDADSQDSTDSHCSSCSPAEAAATSAEEEVDLYKP